MRYNGAPMAPNILRQELSRRLAGGSHIYAAQRAYVALMLETIGRLLVAASATDPEVQREIAGFPEGLTLGFSILGDTLNLRLRYRNGRLEKLTGNLKPDVEIMFKHISHAFLVFSFQESTPRAFANQRMTTQGDAALNMRFTRCLNRMQAVSLPKFVAERALKAVPPMPITEKLALATKLYTSLVLGLASRS